MSAPARMYYVERVAREKRATKLRVHRYVVFAICRSDAVEFAKRERSATPLPSELSVEWRATEFGEENDCVVSLGLILRSPGDDSKVWKSDEVFR